jgi:hypothetical protein
MTCREAPACRAALTEASRRWPNRNRASDGICGDPAHQSRPSDHNRGEAVDVTHDPANGCDAHALVEQLRQRQDPRVKYLISRRRIWNPLISPDWRKYTGSNPHDKHAHISIKASARNDLRAWWGDTPSTPPTPTPSPTPTPTPSPPPPSPPPGLEADMQRIRFDERPGPGPIFVYDCSRVLRDGQEFGRVHHSVSVLLRRADGSPDKARVTIHTPGAGGPHKVDVAAFPTTIWHPQAESMVSVESPVPLVVDYDVVVG